MCCKGACQTLSSLVFPAVYFKTLLAHHKVSKRFVHHCGFCVETYLALKSVEITFIFLLFFICFFRFLLDFGQALPLFCHLEWFISTNLF